MVGNPPASAGGMGSSPGPGGSRVPRSGWARAPQLLGPCAAATEPACLEPVLRGKRGHLNEKPAHRNEDPMQPKVNK